MLFWIVHRSTVCHSTLCRYEMTISKGHVGAMYSLRDVPDEKTRALLGHSTSAVIQQAIFDKSFQLVKPWEETGALSSGTLIGVEAQLRMQNVGESLVRGSYAPRNYTTF